MKDIQSKKMRKEENKYFFRIFTSYNLIAYYFHIHI